MKRRIRRWVILAIVSAICALGSALGVWGWSGIMRDGYDANTRVQMPGKQNVNLSTVGFGAFYLTVMGDEPTMGLRSFDPVECTIVDETTGGEIPLERMDSEYCGWLQGGLCIRNIFRFAPEGDHRYGDVIKLVVECPRNSWEGPGQSFVFIEEGCGNASLIPIVMFFAMFGWSAFLLVCLTIILVKVIRKPR